VIVGKRFVKVGYGGVMPPDGNAYTYIEEDDPRVQFWQADYLKEQNARLIEAGRKLLSRTTIYETHHGENYCTKCNALRHEEHRDDCPVVLFKYGDDE
jgi:hypothetical protein